jgi:hypothetical protein
MWRCVVLGLTDVSEERMASIFVLHAGSSLADFSYPEDGGDKFPWNVGSHKIYTAPRPRRWYSS